MDTSIQTQRRTWNDALVPRVAAGEGQAWRAFHGHHFPIAAAFLRKLGVREPEVEDACQEVFLQAHRYLPRFRGEAVLKTWLYRLCVTEARNVRRRRRRVSEALEGLVSRHPGEAAVPPAMRSERAVLALASGALREMNDGERLVFVLFEMKGLPGKEVAEIAKCPVASVWRRLHDARRTFRAALGAGGPS